MDWLNSEKEGLDIASTPQALVYWPVKVARFVGWATNGGLLSGDLTLLDIVQIVPRCEEAAQKEELESIIGETWRSLFSLLLLSFSPSLLLSVLPRKLTPQLPFPVPSPDYFIHLRAAGKAWVRDRWDEKARKRVLIPLREQVNDPELMMDFTFNDFVLIRLMELGYIQTCLASTSR